MLEYQAILRATIGCLIGGCTLGIPASLNAQVSFSAVNERQVDAEAKIEAALAQRVTLDLKFWPLRDVIDLLQERTGISIKLTKKIEDAGVQQDQPVTISVRNVSAETFLDLMLEDLNLTLIVRNESLFVTTVEDSQSPENMIVRLYPVADLVVDDDFNSLIELISSTIEPDSWQDVGGPSSISSYSGSLVIGQRRDLHQKIAGLLTTLRRVKTLPGYRSLAKPVARPFDGTLQVAPPIKLSSPLPVPNRGNGASLRFRPAAVRPEPAVQVGGGGLF